MDIEKITRDEYELRSLLDRDPADALQRTSQVGSVQFGDRCAPTGEGAPEMKISRMENADHTRVHLFPLAVWRNSTIWSHIDKSLAMDRVRRRCRTMGGTSLICLAG